MGQTGDWADWQCDLITRWYRLRKLGKLYPLLQNDSGRVFTFTNLYDPWGSRVVLDWSQLNRDVEQAEAVINTVRKPAEKERDYEMRTMRLS